MGALAFRADLLLVGHRVSILAMGSVRFTSSRRKLEWAEDYRETLYKELRATLNPGGKPFATEADYETKGRTPSGDIIRLHHIRIARVPQFDTRHGLLLGDTVQNFRAALDHAIWTITRSGKGIPTKKKRLICFPLAQSAKSFKARLKDTVPGVALNSPYGAIIERHQPYKRTDLGKAMLTLRDLSDADKHRVVIPTHVAPSQIELQIKVGGDAWIAAPPTFYIAGQRLKPKAKVADVLARHGPSDQYDMYVKGKIIGYPELPKRLPLKPWLDRIGDACRDLIDELAAVR